MWQFWACHLHLFVKGWDFLLLLVFWCFVIIPLQYPFLTICILIRSFWEHLEGGETRGGCVGGGKALFLHPHALRVCHSPKFHVFFHRPYAVCAGITGVCMLQVFSFLPHPQWYRTKFDQDNAIHWDRFFLGGEALFCLKFKRRKTLNKFVVAPVPPLLLLWRSTERCLYLVNTVPWWRVIVQKACSGNCWTEDC